MTIDLIHLDKFWLSAHLPIWALVIARVSGVCITAPVTVVPGVDWHWRILLAVMLGVVLVPVLEPLIGSRPEGPWVLWLALMELLTGGLLGLSAGLIVAAARQAGDLVAAQAGLSASVLFDPETGEELTPLGRFYGLIAVAVFLAMQGPLVLVGVLVESYRAIPAGGLGLNEATVSQAFAQVGGALALSLRAAAPVAIALVVAGVVLGWIGRLAPVVPFLALSLPVRSLLGIVLIILGLGTLAMTFSQAWTAWPW
jgi:flagellar biosynthesis protein FliR